MNMEDRTGTLLAAGFTDCVTLFDLRAIAVGCYGVATRFNFADDLGRENRSDRAILVENTQRAAIEFRDDANSCLTAMG